MKAKNELEEDDKTDACRHHTDRMFCRMIYVTYQVGRQNVRYKHGIKELLYKLVELNLVIE